MTRKIFDELGCEKIVVHLSASDLRTMKLTEHFGFEFEALHKEACYYDGELHDEKRFILTKQRFLEYYKEGE
jgi:RimJ/RimL family protein N-acetyltransferase